jgi:hypothetical protein
MQLVNSRHAVKARMVDPDDCGYVLLAAETGWRGPLLPAPPARRRLLAMAADCCEALVRRNDVIEATAFRAVLVAPGEGTKLLKARAAKVHRARYDLAVLVGTRSIDSAKRLRQDPAYLDLSQAVRAAARHPHELTARNAVKLRDVDHRPDHVFLFNYFYADDPAELIPVFRYTAGWFQAKTSLPDSTLLQPLEGEPDQYGIINHASWPNFRTFLPSLLFRPTFRSFVLANFAANHIAAQPILYRRVHTAGTQTQAGRNPPRVSPNAAGGMP